jgi:hypothetical protein
MTPQEMQKVIDELEASRSSRKRAWENLFAPNALNGFLTDPDQLLAKREPCRKIACSLEAVRNGGT